MLPQNNKIGFGIIEIIIAVAMFLILLFGGMVFITQGLNMNRLADQETQATYFASEGLEAVRSIKNISWKNLDMGNTNCTSVLSKGVTNPGTTWSWTDTNQTKNIFTRAITMENVCRNVSGNIDTAGTIYDKNLKKINSTVTWSFSQNRKNKITLSTYLSNYKAVIMGDWSAPFVGGTLDLSGTTNALKVGGEGDYAYIIRPGANPNFISIDISTTKPFIAGSLNLSGNPTDIFVSEGYAYVSSQNTAQELQIVNVTNPKLPSLAGFYNAAGTSVGTSVRVKGTSAYLTKKNSSSAEFFIINISTPTSPSLIGSLNLNGDAMSVAIEGNFAAVASTNNSSELELINISTPSSPKQVGTYDIGGSTDPNTVEIVSNYVFIGKADGSMTIINITTPASPIYGNTYGGAGGVIYDSYLGNNNKYIFLATSAPTRQFQMANISNPISYISTMGTISLNNTINGIYYDEDYDQVYAVSQSDTGEFMIINSKPL